MDLRALSWLNRPPLTAPHNCRQMAVIMRRHMLIARPRISIRRHSQAHRLTFVPILMRMVTHIVTRRSIRTLHAIILMRKHVTRKDNSTYRRKAHSATKLTLATRNKTDGLSLRRTCSTRCFQMATASAVSLNRCAIVRTRAALTSIRLPRSGHFTLTARTLQIHNRKHKLLCMQRIHSCRLKAESCLSTMWYL
jgi:hypothetical protein